MPLPPSLNDAQSDPLSRPSPARPLVVKAPVGRGTKALPASGCDGTLRANAPPGTASPRALPPTPDAKPLARRSGPDPGSVAAFCLAMMALIVLLVVVRDAIHYLMAT